MVQDIYSVHTIWGKKIASLKEKTTRKKPIQVVGDIVKITKGLIKLQK